MTALAIALAAAAGYLLGRTRPWRRLYWWADVRIPDSGHWWHAPPHAAAAWWATAPRGALHAWRHRTDTPKETPR